MHTKQTYIISSSSLQTFQKQLKTFFIVISRQSNHAVLWTLYLSHIN